MDEDPHHPRHTARLIGQDHAIGAFLQAYNTNRLHHGWLLTGPKGVGKATLAWQIAKYLLANPPGASLFGDMPADNLHIDPNSTVIHQIMAGAHPSLTVVTRGTDEKTGRQRQVIIADDIRKLNGFLQLSNVDGGWRVVIIDSADDMNPQAANALLKLLEEPPEKTLMLLVSHQPSGLLATIRSRCRTLKLRNLGQEELLDVLVQHDQIPTDIAVLHELAAGSVGEALTLLQQDGIALYADLVAMMADLPNIKRAAILKLAQDMAARGKDQKLDLLLHLIDTLIARITRAGVMGPPLQEAAANEAALLTRLSPDHYSAHRWADTGQQIRATHQHARAINLDPDALVIDTMLKINECAGLAAR